jgi:uncharacterized short protein YbdD (DUF466 family)
MTAAAREDRSPAAQSPEDGVRQRLRGFCSACRQVFGMPDYERYLAHAAVQHPGAVPLTRSEFFEQAIERRYGRGGARCC